MFSPRWGRKNSEEGTPGENPPPGASQSTLSTIPIPGGSTKSSSSSSGHPTTTPSRGYVATYSDLSSWNQEEVIVPPGPLGIFLNPSNRSVAVLDKFAPVSENGDRGAIEVSGKVLRGSVLVGVNEHDFMATKASFREVGDVLKELASKQRVMRWRVPPADPPPAPAPAPVPVTPVTENDTQSLIKEPRTSSFAESSAGATKPESRSILSPKSWVSKGLRSPSLSPRTAKDPLNEVGPTDAGENSTMQPSRVVIVMAPPGPLGLNLDGEAPHCAKVIGFTRMEDGSASALERHGGIVPDSLLIGINGEDVSTATRLDICTKLGQLKNEERELKFLLPPPPQTPSAQHSTSTANAPLSNSSRELYVEDLDRRRKMELQLVMKHDTAKLDRRECWFMVDAQWMSSWVKYAAQQGPLPGPISNERLLVDDWEVQPEEEDSTPRDLMRKDLKVGVHYRGVSPMVWCLLSQLHTTDRAPELARYMLDINADAVAGGDLDKILRAPMLKAAVLVQAIQDKCQTRVQ